MRDADAPAPVEDAPKDGPQAVGAALRAARKSRGISLEQISERLRIEPRSLVALEEERFEALGAPVFVKGYLKLYSDYLGLDTARLLGIYRAGHDADEPIVQARRSLENEEQRPAGMWMAAAAAAVVVAAVLWLLREPEVNAPAEAATTAVDAEIPAEPEADAAAPAESAASTSGVSEAVLERARAGAEFDAEVDAELAPEGDAEAEAVPAAEVEVQPIAGAELPAAAGGTETAVIEARDAAAGAETTAAVISPTRAGELAIAVRFVEDSWAEIVDARDARLFYGLGRAGADARFNAASPVSVLFGNADGVVLEVDGEAFPYPENSRRGRLVEFTVSTPAE